MSDIDEYCEIRTEGGKFRRWLGVNVSQNVDRRWAREFSVICAEPDDAEQRLYPGMRVDIALAGQVIIQEGYIVKRNSFLDARRKMIQVAGFSKAGVITRVSLDPVGGGQFRNYTLQSIANTVLKPYGIKFKIQNGGDGAETPFPNVNIRHGETPFDFIARLCRQRALWFWAEPDGTLVAGSKEGGGGVTFEEGRNILEIRCSLEMPAVNEIVGRSQQQGSDSLFGRKAAEISAKSSVQSQGATFGKRIVLAEMPLTQKELQSRTNMEAQDMERTFLQCTITYKGWLNPAGKLWDVAEDVTVRSQSAFPVEGNTQTLKVWGYTYLQDAEGGTITTLELVNQATFGLKYADASSKADFFNAPAKPAVPEIET